MVDRLSDQSQQTLAGTEKRSVSDAVAPDDHPGLPKTRSAVGIVHAQDRHALTHATTAKPADRPRAFAEARRLLRVATALASGINATKEANAITAPVPGERQPRTDRRTRREPYEHVRV